jgi:maleylpyruvate isomerase
MTDERLAWVRAAHDEIAARAAALTDGDLAAPSLLPGWTRAHVLAHIARNADGLLNLVTWAETGVETPMYASFESREADIESSAAQPADDLRADVAQADDRLLTALEALSADAGAVMVRALRGGPFPAGELPWVRSREAWVHLVDLDAGVTFDDVPAGVGAGLLDEAVERGPERDLASGFVLEEDGSGRRWVLGREDPSTTVTGTRAELLGWLTGRVPPGEWPEPPPWP